MKWAQEQPQKKKPFPFLFPCGFILFFCFWSKMEGGGDAKSPPGAAPRGPPGAALGGAATTRQVGQQHALDAYNKRLDSAVAKLNEHYANILKSAKVHTPPAFSTTATTRDACVLLPLLGAHGNQPFRRHQVGDKVKVLGEEFQVDVQTSNLVRVSLCLCLRLS
jgi:hypothetical protein